MILKYNYNLMKKKKSFYLNIFLSQYCVQKYCVWIGPYQFKNIGNP